MEEENDSPVQLLGKNQRSGPRKLHLSEREVRKELVLDLLQGKSFLIPVGISFIALIFAFLYAPVVGGFSIALGISIVAGLAGIAVFFWRYVIRFQHNYALKSQELVARFEEQNLYLEEQRLTANGMLEAGFSEVNATEGLNILRALDQEYRFLRLILKSGKVIDLLSISNLDSMVKETYFRGLSVLEDVLELERAIRFTDQGQLESEIAELQRKAAAAGADPSQQNRFDKINERIASNQERLRSVINLQQRVEELVYQAKRCEASLGKTRIELAALKAGASETGISAVIETLGKTIDRARDVQEELKRKGYGKEGG